LARAAQLLVDQRVPVKRVAQMVGFASRSAFSRAFVEVWGQSPRAFRLGQER
jgi:transcriptional regulator GlxA family with amidase domain